MSFDGMVTELLGQHPSLSIEEVTLLHATMTVVAWGLDFMANQVLTSVNQIMDISLRMN